MEYVQGGALSDYIANQSTDWAAAINLIIPVAEALAYAHGQGVIHRDVKPSNILLPQQDWPLLADFGLVKLPSAEKAVTRSGTSMGTPAYVAPEQARGAVIDHRADMYSLGVILFEMLTGRLPFNYSNPNKVLLAHISEPIPFPRHFNPECPTSLEQIIVTMMQKSPDDRYKDIGEVIVALRGVMASSQERPAFHTPAQPAPEARERLQTVEFVHDPKQSSPQPPQPLSPPPPAGTAPLPPTPLSPSSVEPQLEAQILLTDKNATLQVPDQDSAIIGRTHRDTFADLDLGPYGAAKLGISRHHARLTRQDNQWLLEDLGSLNGTFVNDVQVKSGSPVLLNNGDVIRCSHMSFVFLVSPRAK